MPPPAAVELVVLDALVPLLDALVSLLDLLDDPQPRPSARIEQASSADTPRFIALRTLA
jgi:hypothetical protein